MSFVVYRRPHAPPQVKTAQVQTAAPPATPGAPRPTVRDLARLAGYLLGAGVVAALYLFIPLMVALHAALPSLPYGVLLLVLALALAALGEVAIVRILRRTSPQRETALAPRQRAHAYSGPADFDVELSAIPGDERGPAFPAVGRGIPAGRDEMVVRVGSARWRDYRGDVALKAYLSTGVMRVRAKIERAEDVPMRGRPQCVLHLRIVAMRPDDSQRYFTATS
jgi:hypothetical protein